MITIHVVSMRAMTIAKQLNEKCSPFMVNDGKEELKVRCSDDKMVVPETWNTSRLYRLLLSVTVLRITGDTKTIETFSQHKHRSLTPKRI